MTSEPDEAEIAALADGSLPEARRRAVEARVAASPELRAALERQHTALAAIRDAEVPAPGRVSSWLDTELGPRAANGAAPGPPAHRRRLAWALAAAVAVAVVALAMLLPARGGPGDVGALAAAATRPPTAGAPQPAPENLLTVASDGIAFPDWQPRLGWRPTGRRADDVAGRRAVTVIYARDGRRFAYAILGRPALDLPGGEGTYRDLTHDGRPAVAWIRKGRTCLLVGLEDVPRRELRELARSTRFY